MSFFKNIFGKKASVRCSQCNSVLEYLGGLESMFPKASITGMGDASGLEQWRGNVCTTCRIVFCGKCISLGGPTACPKCGSLTKPAQRVYLEQIGIFGVASTSKLDSQQESDTHQKDICAGCGRTRKKY